MYEFLVMDILGNSWYRRIADGVIVSGSGERYNQTQIKYYMNENIRECVL